MTKSVLIGTKNLAFLQKISYELQVACAFCSVQLFDWKAGDDSLLEHRKFSPNCPLLMGYLVGNVALDESGSGALIDHGEDDDNYEIVSTTSEESDVTGILEPEQVIIHPFSGNNKKMYINCS
jgi:Inhibitor of Apoptosis domain